MKEREYQGDDGGEHLLVIDEGLEDDVEDYVHGGDAGKQEVGDAGSAGGARGLVSRGDEVGCGDGGPW